MMELNVQQKAAAEYGEGHVLVLAGAGTGKTRTIIARAAYLIDKGVNPGRILLLAFTRRAAGEMKQRLFQLVGEKGMGIRAGTFHHFCLYSMRRMPESFGILNDTVIDRDDQLQLMKLIRKDYMKRGEDFPTASQLISLCSYARNTDQDPKEYLEHYTEHSGEMIKKILGVFGDYEERKRKNKYLDYDDILFRFAENIHENEELNHRIRGFYDHILVDEMQDTNPLQWKILDGIKDPASLFCVGDDAQSIYGFRGADFRNVHSFTDRIPNSVILKLEENYRSSQGILDLSNWLLGSSGVPYNKKLFAHRKKESTPRMIVFGNEFDESRWVVRDLLERKKDGYSLKDCMIITRTGYGARNVETHLLEVDIPYRFIGGISLLQAAHVKDLICFLRASTNHLDELAWLRYLKLWPGIGDVTANRHIEGMAKCETFGDAMRYLREKLPKKQEIVNGATIVHELIDAPSNAANEASEFLASVLAKKYENWSNRRKEIDLLTARAVEHEDLFSFLETYALEPPTPTMAMYDDEDDTVTIITVHSAKGTEAKICYLIKVEPGMYPHFRSLGSEDDIEEERRILYVAMTRAQDELIITRSDGGHFGDNYFLEDLDERLVQMEWKIQGNRYMPYRRW